MNLSKETTTIILSAASKALATDGPAGLNVVPVSVVSMIDGKIMLYNFFMNKTVKNISVPNTPVALTCWDGLMGVQVRARATHYTKGDAFTAAESEMKEKFPDYFIFGVWINLNHGIYMQGVRL